MTAQPPLARSQTERGVGPGASIEHPGGGRQGRGPLRALAALRHPNYRLYWLGQTVSLLGT